MKKVVLITGGSSGIGKAIGNYLLSKDFEVFGTSRNPDQIANSSFPLLAMDVRNIDTIQNVVKEIIEKTGRLDVVINNAGVGITGPIEEIPTEEIKNNFEINLFGPNEEIKAA
jgi:NAD(P)-dependent dehydrogenase (short-subunit alcohol dehydrogenase family)